MSIHDLVVERAQSARRAAAVLRTAPTAQKNDALGRMADLILRKNAAIKRANDVDLELAEEKGLSAAMIDRLRLTEERLAAMAEGLRAVAAQDDPVGRVDRTWTRPNGLQISKVRIPIGVIGIIYESRPNVTADAAGLCLKAGNAVVLRGGSEAINSNVALAEVLRSAIQSAGLPEGCVELIPVTDREAIQELIKLDEYLDLLIPRGGEGLIAAVKQEATIPVISHDKGLTHIYVDAQHDADLAVKVVHNAKVQRPGVCNALETLLVHAEAARATLPKIAADLQAAGVELRGDLRACSLVPGMNKAADEDWDTEYLNLILSVRVVDSLNEALEHIARHSSGLAEAIITTNDAAAERFLSAVDSATVYVNASTRFTDGGEFGLGAEIGISTAKIHARGPMGVEELTTYKYLVRGTGQCRT
jgi:glutamate-5-semialdehyde dehydrogenase